MKVKDKLDFMRGRQAHPDHKELCLELTFMKYLDFYMLLAILNNAKKKKASKLHLKSMKIMFNIKLSAHYVNVHFRKTDHRCYLFIFIEKSQE